MKRKNVLLKSKKRSVPHTLGGFLWQLLDIHPTVIVLINCSLSRYRGNLFDIKEGGSTYSALGDE